MLSFLVSFLLLYISVSTYDILDSDRYVFENRTFIDIGWDKFINPMLRNTHASKAHVKTKLCIDTLNYKYCSNKFNMLYTPEYAVNLWSRYYTLLNQLLKLYTLYKMIPGFETP